MGVEKKCDCIKYYGSHHPECPVHPSPEARVDWDRQAEIIIHSIPADCEDDYFQMSKTIIKNALQAAFEKGREAR